MLNIEAYIYGHRIGIIMENTVGVRFQYDKNFPEDKLPISPFYLPFEPTRVFNYHDNCQENGSLTRR
jgi:HipA N-terminal domain